jgi:hypothetical protein
MVEMKLIWTTFTWEVCAGEGGGLVRVPVCDCVAECSFMEPIVPSTWDHGVGFDGSVDGRRA